MGFSILLQDGLRHDSRSLYKMKLYLDPIKWPEINEYIGFFSPSINGVIAPIYGLFHPYKWSYDPYLWVISLFHPLFIGVTTYNPLITCVCFFWGAPTLELKQRVESLIRL